MREGSQSERAEVFPGVTHHGNPIFELLDQCRGAGKRGPCLRGKSPLCAAGQTML